MQASIPASISSQNLPLFPQRRTVYALHHISVDRICPLFSAEGIIYALHHIPAGRICPLFPQRELWYTGENRRLRKQDPRNSFHRQNVNIYTYTEDIVWCLPGISMPSFCSKNHCREEPIFVFGRTCGRNYKNGIRK